MSASASRSSSISQGNNPYPFYQQDAIRVFVQQSEGGDQQEQSTRRFSVDPQLTNFEIIKNLIGRAFDMKSDFTISYRALDDYGGEAYLPMVSDWDLSAAFLSASDPDLQLMIKSKNVPASEAYDGVSSWEEVKTNPEVIRNASPLKNRSNSSSSNSSSVSSLLKSQRNNYSNNNGIKRSAPVPSSADKGYSFSNTFSSSSATPNITSSSKVLSAMSQLGGAVNQYPISLNTKINTTGIFNTMEKWVQKAKTFVEDLSVVTSRPPLSDLEFRNYLDVGGVLCRPRELRYVCYHGGVEPSLRKVVWKHLLNVYPDGLNGNERMEYIRNKSKEYYELRDTWKTAMKNGQVTDGILSVSNMVRKDVLRTDRHLEFFAGKDDNQNIALLFNILTTYALNHPSVGYCQGMSDLASPLLYTMGDEAQAYVCFTALMDRLKPNFNCDGIAMSVKFAHLAEALAYYDQPFWNYLKSIGADDLLFCYRWLLLEMKREFAFEDALQMMEVLWASHAYQPQDVSLFEVKFTLSNAHSIPIPVPTMTATYSKVCAMRRSSTSVGSNEMRQRRLSRKKKVNPLSLDENSLSSMNSTNSSSYERSHTKPFHSLDETTEKLASGEFANSPFEILSQGSDTPSTRPKLIKNLKEFWTIGKARLSGGDSGGSTPFSPDSSRSSTVSNLESMQQNIADEAESNGQVFFDDPIESDITTEVDPNEASPYHQRSTSNQREDFSNSKNSVGSFSHDQKLLKTNNYLGKSDEKENSGTSLTSSVELSHGVLNNLKHESNTPRDQVKDELYTKTLENLDNGSGSVISDINSEYDSGRGVSDDVITNSLQDPDFILRGQSQVVKRIPTPDRFGGGNAFLMFLCLTLLIQHKDFIMNNNLDYNETAMYFDKMVRKHNVTRVLAHAREYQADYIKLNNSRAQKS